MVHIPTKHLMALTIVIGKAFPHIACSSKKISCRRLCSLIHNLCCLEELRVAFLNMLTNVKKVKIFVGTYFTTFSM